MTDEEVLQELVIGLSQEVRTLKEKVAELEDALTEEDRNGGRRPRRTRLSLKDFLALVATMSAALSATAVPIILAVLGTK